MKQALKKELKHIFEAPAPLHKKEFLLKLEEPKMSIYEFILSQIGYIRKWIWGISILVFTVSLVGAVMLSFDMLWGISALTPLLALSIISESGRSEVYEMAELEMATRFSLRSVVFARLGILSIENLVLLCLLLPIGIWNNMLSPIKAGIYIITPFLLTTFMGLYIVRKFRGHDAIYLYVGLAICVSFSVFFFRFTFPQIYQENYLMWWIVGVLLLCIGTVKQYCRMVNRMEELV